MIDVGQALKNNIIIFAICGIVTFGASSVCGLAVKSEVFLLAVIAGVWALAAMLAGIWKWNGILKQIKMLKENKSYVEKDGDKAE